MLAAERAEQEAKAQWNAAKVLHHHELALGLLLLSAADWLGHVQCPLTQSDCSGVCKTVCSAAPAVTSILLWFVYTGGGGEFEGAQRGHHNCVGGCLRSAC